MGGYSGGGTAGYPYPTNESLRAAQPEDVDRSFVVAVLDTGVTIDGPNKQPHPYIAPNLALGWDDHPDARENYSSDEEVGYDHDGLGPRSGRLDGHGTFVAGVILREAPFATLEMRNPLDGPTKPVRDNEIAVANALKGLKDIDDVRLVNLGGYNILPDEPAPAEIEKALDELFGVHENALVVTSLSNDWSDATVWPAGFNSYDRFRGKIIAVGAVDETPTPYSRTWRTPPRASFANWGGVDVWASGVSVLGPHLQPDARLVSGEQATGWVRWSGTPFATAAVTGMIARMLKYCEPGTTALQAFERLIGPRPGVKLPGVDGEMPWLRVRGSRWPEFPGV